MENVFEAFRRSGTRMMEVLFQPFNGVTYLFFVLVFLFSDCGSTHSFNSNTNLDTSSIPPLGDIEPMVAGIGVTVALVVVAVVVVLTMLLWGFTLFLSSYATMLSLDGLQRGEPG